MMRLYLGQTFTDIFMDSFRGDSGPFDDLLRKLSRDYVFPTSVIIHAIAYFLAALKTVAALSAF
jgi:hypothetical protein